MPVHAVGVLPEKIFLFYIGSIADNNQKMKGKKEYERKNGRGKEVQTNVSIRPRACFFPLFSFLPLWLHYNLNPLCVQY